MHQTAIKVRYEQGNLVPLEPIMLKDGQEAVVLMQDASGDTTTTGKCHPLLAKFYPNSLLELLEDPEEDIYEDL